MTATRFIVDAHGMLDNEMMTNAKRPTWAKEQNMKQSPATVIQAELPVTGPLR